MDTNDKNIKDAFANYTESFDINLEESVMEGVNLEKNYSGELSLSKKRIKIGMVLSAFLMIAYLALTYFEVVPQHIDGTDMNKVYMTSIFSALIVLIMYMISLFSLSLGKNNADNIVA